MTPIPPSLAMAIAISLSVTVSIAALTNGELSFMFRENFVLMSDASGRKSAYWTTSERSSKVSPSNLNADMNSSI
jgi:hypothetical protein